MKDKIKAVGGFFAGMVPFWKRQDKDWKVTVVRTSLERLGYQIVYPYLSIYIVALGANKSQLGLFTCIGMLIAGLLGPLTGSFIDRRGTKNVYVLGIAMLMVAYGAYALAPAWPVAAFAMVVYYLGSGTSIHSCGTICGNCLENCDRAKGMMICESIAAGLLGMVGPLIAAFILTKLVGVTGSPTEASDMRPLFFVTLGITTVSLIVVLTNLSNRTWTSGKSSGFHVIKDGLAILKGNKSARKWLVIAAVANMPTGMILPFCQVFAQEVKGADVLTLSGMVTAAAVTSVLCGYPIGALADKIGRKKVLFITIPLFCLSNILLILAKSPAVLIIAGVLQGFYYIGGPLSAAMQRELVSPAVMGQWIGINRLISAIVGSAAAVFSGLLYDKVGPQYLFIIYVCCEAFVRLPLLASIPETLHMKAKQV